jgi:3-hydroxybenzoate 6-monooxygenase
MNVRRTLAKSVMIAGGGIGGLSAALVLGRDGYSVEVLEQSESFGEIGAGIQLGPNVFKMFEYLGLTEAINRVAFFPTHLGMRDVLSGEWVIRVPLGETVRSVYGHPYGVIYRADLHQVLLDACQRVPSIRLSTKTKLATFAQQEDRVVARFVNGDTREADALIGADGMWSSVREAIVGDGKPRVSGHIAYRAVLKREEVPTHLWSNEVTLWGGEKTHLVTYPLRRGELFNLVAVFHSDRYEEGWNTFGDIDELHQRFANAAPEVRALLAKINAWKMWVLCDREPVKGWSKGNVTLLGDAAHPMLQYLAQGAGQAIEDACVLREALRATGGNFAEAFAKYEAARYLRTARVQLTARLYGDIYHASGVARELRNQLFQSGKEAAGFAGLKWMYDGIDPTAMFKE